MRFLQSLLKDANAMHEQSHVATNLMSDIRDLAYDLEDIMDTYMPALATRERKGFFGWLKSSISIFCDYSTNDFVTEVKAIRRWVDEINSARNLLNVTQSVPGNKSNVGGFAWLATLMKEDDSSTLHFKCLVKVVVSQEPNVKELLEDIARQVGLEKDKWEEKVEVNLL
ncbi:hypothetical protein F0562_034383 [Nyssa sinensis]|uniref:Disease resistance N-terminal domain-containing protein n=1 Tax=Nyssa sinensis TaxID=561372 RepID=A0A5J5AI70_9ASTE|nr:hypothetical protein F0562_034383 [Nyssa sinensis]